jgi:hypothetical protein
MASFAQIECQKTYEDHLHKYQENNFTYVPMPFEGLYFDREENTLKGMKEEQYYFNDSGIRISLDYLCDHPFLLLSFGWHDLYFDANGEIKKSSLGDNVDTFEDVRAFQNLSDDEKAKVVSYCNENELYEMITRADVNRRIVKEALYPVIAELEEKFVEVIKESDQGIEELHSLLKPETIGR